MYIPPRGLIFIDNLSIASLLTISCPHLASGGSPRALPGGQRSTLHRDGRFHAVGEIVPVVRRQAVFFEPLFADLVISGTMRFLHIVL